MVRTVGVAICLSVSAATAQEFALPVAAPAPQGLQPNPALPYVPAAFPQPQPPHPVQPPLTPSPELQLLWQKLAQRDALQQEIEALCVATNTPQQLIVRTKIAEVNVTKMRKLGVEFAAAGVAGSTAVARFFPQTPEMCHFSVSNEPIAVNGFLDALVKNNVARALSDPTIAVVSGRPAKFHVGGELAVPGGKSATAEFKSFGTQLDVLATSLGSNRVRVEVRPRIAEVDNSQKIEVDGQEVPGLRVREIDTGTEMNIGDALVLTGLTQERVETKRRALGRVEEKQEIALMVVVTVENAQPKAEFPAAATAVQPASANVPYTPAAR